jgi:hypothetical protein
MQNNYLLLYSKSPPLGPILTQINQFAAKQTFSIRLILVFILFFPDTYPAPKSSTTTLYDLYLTIIIIIIIIIIITTLPLLQ